MNRYKLLVVSVIHQDLPNVDEVLDTKFLLIERKDFTKQNKFCTPKKFYALECQLESILFKDEINLFDPQTKRNLRATMPKSLIK